LVVIDFVEILLSANVHVVQGVLNVLGRDNLLSRLESGQEDVLTPWNSCYVEDERS
jgi:hypothetical protein